ncbi:MAG: hypothetical protein U0835_08550 [Isosphaeraceae bacterium]
MSCRGHTTGVCDRETMVPRRRAEEMIVAAVAERVLACPEWRAEVLAALEAESRRLEAQAPDLLRQARRQLADAEQKVRRLVDSVEEGDAPHDLHERLATRSAEAEELRRRVAELQKAEDDRPTAPTAEWVDEQFRRLETLLSEGGTAAALALRDLVGGRVDVLRSDGQAASVTGRELRFTVAGPDLLGHFPGAPPKDPDALPSRTTEVVLDLREPAPWEQIEDQVMNLWKQGLLLREIAERLGCG